METLFQIFKFMIKQKKLWLAPIILALFFFGLLIVLVEGYAIAPFIYALF